MMKRYFSGGALGKGDLGKRPKEDKGRKRMMTFLSSITAS
jgi:hypothetical protein